MTNERKKAVLGLSLEQVVIIIGLVLFAIIFIPIFVKIIFNTESAIGGWSDGILEKITGFSG